MRRVLLSVLALLWPLALAAQEPPPAYPRPGATKLLENERVIVWHIAWLQQEYPLHRHRYDHIGVYYTTGDRIITSAEGEKRPLTTEAWNLSFQPRGVTHVEQGASEDPLRAVFVQIKDETRSESAEPTTYLSNPPTQRLDNERTTVWDFGPASEHTGARHRHAHDAVVVSFDAMTRPTVRYVARGSMHDTDADPGSTRTIVFEVK